MPQVPPLPAQPMPFRLPAPLLLAAFLGVALGGMLDYQLGAISWRTFPVAHIHYWFCGALALALVATDREGPLKSRLKRFGGLVLAGLVLTYLLHDLADRESRRTVIGLIGSDSGFYLWLLGMWLAMPLLARRRPDATPRPGWLRGAAAALIVYVALCLATAAASESAKASLQYFRFERALPLAMIAGWWRAVEVNDRLRRRTMGGAALMLGLLMVVALAIGWLDWLGGESLRAALAEARLIHVRIWNLPGDVLPQRRLIFPMLHFNRTAWQAMLAMGVMALAAIEGRRRGAGWQWAAWAIAMAAFAVIFMSHTRALLLVATVVMLGWAAMHRWRLALALLVVGAIGLALAPGPHRAHLGSILRAESWDVSQGELNSVKSRLLVFDWGVDTIGEHPLTGLGYGWKIVYDAFNDFVDAGKADPRLAQSIESGHEMNHLHNLWLETAAESGLLTALALLAFLALRWVGLVRWWRAAEQEDRQAAMTWLALELMIVLGAMGFYMLKQNSGLLTWWVWAAAAMAADAGLRSAATKKAGRA